LNLLCDLLNILQAKLACRRRQKRGFSFLVRFFFFRQDKKEKMNIIIELIYF